MPLRDTAAFDDWVVREWPSSDLKAAVADWIDALGHAPWQAPSTPFAELSDLPNYEIRSAELPKADGVEVFYRREFEREVVDLIWVGRLGQAEAQP